MFWNKKEDKSALPDLPPIQSPFNKEAPINESQSSEENDESDDFNDMEKHSLPSFPDSPISKGFSQAAIKDAVTNDEVEVNDSSSEKILSAKSFKTIEMEESDNEQKPLYSIKNDKNYQEAESSVSLSSPTISQSQEIMDSKNSLKLGPPPMPFQRFNPKPQLQFQERTSSKSQTPDIFIKIDKFNAARKSLSSAQEQINQIDELLKRIRETKLREEQELAAWEKEFASVKSRIQNVTEAIFEKI